MADDEDKKEYRWEGGYEKTWEVVSEDDRGFLSFDVEDAIRRSRRRKLQERQGLVRLGVMRHLFVVVDLSEAMQDQDMKPTRYICTLKLLEKFVQDFFDHNPISQLGLIVTKNKRAEKLTELTGNAKVHIAALKNAIGSACSGEPSLYNALDIAIKSLKNMPSHTSREIVIIMGSLTTCDPAGIHKQIQLLKSCNIRCSVIGLAAEVRVCRTLTKETGGTYGVILDENHFRELVFEHLNPPPAVGSAASSLIRMGFPKEEFSHDKGKPSMCMCHLDDKSGTTGFGVKGYYCPQCQGKYCELPAECKACGLTLVSAPHLARSYHHFFPLDNFIEVKLPNLDPSIAVSRTCTACCKTLSQQSVYQCSKCLQNFCFDCDIYIHETLHTCPGCANSPQMLQQEFGNG